MYNKTPLQMFIIIIVSSYNVVYDNMANVVNVVKENV